MGHRSWQPKQEPREPSRKGDRSATSRILKCTSRIRAVAFLVVIVDKTEEEEESDAVEKGRENSTEENRIGGWIGQEGDRRKSYSTAVIDGIKRKSRIFVGDSIVRKTDSRLSKGRMS